MHQLQPLRRHLLVQTSHAGHVAAGSVQAGDKSDFDGVGSCRKDDWNLAGSRLRRHCRSDAARSYQHGHAIANQTRRKLREPAGVRLRPPIFDLDVLALYIARRT